MPRQPGPIDASEWITRIFSARAAAEGAVVRRKLSDIDRIFGRDYFLGELDRRGFQAVVNAGQVVIFCNREPVEFLSRARDRRTQIPHKEFAKSL